MKTKNPFFFFIKILIFFAILAGARHSKAYTFQTTFNATTTPYVAGSASGGHLLSTNTAIQSIVCSPGVATIFYVAVTTSCDATTFASTYANALTAPTYCTVVPVYNAPPGTGLFTYPAESVMWYLYKVTLTVPSTTLINVPTWSLTPPAGFTNNGSFYARYICGLASTATLTTLTPSIGTLSPIFNSATLNYTVTLPFGTAAQQATLACTNWACIDTTKLAATNVAGTLTQRTAKVTAISYDNTDTKVYNVVFSITPGSTNNLLSALTTTPISTLSPTFISTTTSYTAVLPAGTTGSVSLNPTLASGTATIASNTAASNVNGTLAQRTGTVVVNSQAGISKTYTIVFTVAISAPTSLIATASTTAPNNVTLSWTDNASNETSYQVIRNGVTIATLAANTTSYIDNSVAYSTAYSYSIKVVNATSNALSNVANVTTMNTPANTTDISDVEMVVKYAYPNPVVDMLTIEFNNNSEKQVDILSISGALISSFVTNDELLKINFESFTSGIYVVQIITNSRKEFHKIVK